MFVEDDREVGVNEPYWKCLACGGIEYPKRAPLLLPKLRRREPQHAGRIL